jgi:hypothetical protein
MKSLERRSATKLGAGHVITSFQSLHRDGINPSWLTTPRSSRAIHHLRYLPSLLKWLKAKKEHGENNYAGLDGAEIAEARATAKAAQLKEMFGVDRERTGTV